MASQLPILIMRPRVKINHKTQLYRLIVNYISTSLKEIILIIKFYTTVNYLKSLKFNTTVLYLKSLVTFINKPKRKKHH